MNEKLAEQKKVNNQKQLVVFRLNNEEYGLEINNVQEIIRLARITPVPQASNYILGVINIRGKILPVVDLKKRFGMKEREDTPNVRIIVVEIEDTHVGLKVDSASEVLSINESDIEGPPEFIDSQIELDFISGVGKVDDRLIIILNIKKIFSQKEIEEIKSES